MKVAILLSVLLAANVGLTKELSGLKMDDQTTLGGKTLLLNDMGVRRAYGIMKVYVAGLYLAAKSQKADEILKSSTPKEVQRKFVHEVEVEKIRNAWSEGVEKNCVSECDDAKKGLLGLGQQN